MNSVHLHLILNHIPVIGIPMALGFLAYSLRNRNLGAQRFSLLVLVVCAALVVPTYLTGERSEEIIEKLLGRTTENVLEAHEEAAEVSLVLTLVAGIGALLALLLTSRVKSRKLLYPVFGLSLIAFMSLAYTGWLGGEIRHPEIKSLDGAHQGLQDAAGRRPHEDEKDARYFDTDE